MPTFDTTVETTSFPLSYNLDDVEPGLQPHPDVYCDCPTCKQSDPSTVIRLACFHCFHRACLPSNQCCPICLGPLKKKAEKLANTFNTGLVSSKVQQDPEESCADLNEDECCSTPDPTSMNTTDAEMFYTSTEWSDKVDNILNTYAAIPLPSRANHSTNNQPSPTPNTTPTSNSNSSARVLTPIIIPPNHDGNITFWSFPSSISQSTILGRMGSNACTFISLLFGKLFLSSNVDIPAIHTPLSQTWVYQLVVQGILVGNSIYDSVTQNIPRTFGVLEALQASALANNVIGRTTMGPELPVSIIQEASPAASLPFHWRNALTQGQTASIFILGCNTCFYPDLTRDFPFRQPPPWEQWSSCGFCQMAAFLRTPCLVQES